MLIDDFMVKCEVLKICWGDQLLSLLVCSSLRRCPILCGVFIFGIIKQDALLLLHKRISSGLAHLRKLRFYLLWKAIKISFQNSSRQISDTWLNNIFLIGQCQKAWLRAVLKYDFKWYCTNLHIMVISNNFWGIFY